ncbi:glycosyltransferase family 1 protein [Anabaena sp. FACHB-1237]|uniref:glycosyltransferase n=1 Tax=Anabaena sp. FACHB-1237 TaxID=2692769 RepID=UPI0016801846|nr:glycosyltransferase [Anabaena sp. FACHB-1237]MBD2138619.1 glycosyltransferase family 1 protein [Anabaena sp. FACHB-1237]
MKKYIMFVSLPLMGHMNQMIAIAQELVERGHKVSFVIPEIAKNWISTTGAEFINWEIMLNEIESSNDEKDNIWQNVSQEKSILHSEKIIFERFIKLYSPMYQSLISIFEKYHPDLLIIDRAVIAAMDLAQQMNIPYIIQTRFLGNFVKTSSKYPHFSTSYSINMNLWERCLNYLQPILSLPFLIPNMIKLNQLRQKCTNNKKLNDPFNKQLIIVGTSFGIEIPRKIPPFVQMVGPIFPKITSSPSPSLSTWLEDKEAANGIIYVAFGTLAEINKWQCQVLVTGLKNTKLKVLWSLPTNNHHHLPDLPDSFRIENFVPQQTVLAHPNVRAFVSHCGMNSINESLYFAKPILALPFFGDQHYNAARIVDIGVGLKLNKQKFDSTEVTTKINHLLTNSTYKEAANRMSDVLKNSGGLNKAVDIVEKMLLEGIDYFIK